MQPDSKDLATALSTGVEVSLLGEVATRRAGVLVPLPGLRARTLLAALARTPGRTRSATALIEDVWGDEPPRSPLNALHTQISRLRSALPDGVLESGPAGYRLALDRTGVDLTLARACERHAQRQHADGDHRGAVTTVRQALALWRGEPGTDLVAGEPAREIATEARSCADALAAVELAALVALGEFEQALPLARAAVDREPLGEQAHGHLMLVLAGLGRGNDALEVFAGIRNRLADQLGADPSPWLTDLNTTLLRGGTPRGAARPAPPHIAPEHVAEQLVPPSIGLRAAPNALLGRDEDLTALDALLRSARVVTVLGPGGIGKTRIAHEIGLRVSRRTQVALVELASVRDGSDVVAAIAAVLGIGEFEVKPGAASTRVRLHDVRDRLREALALRPSLLILDNCEHLIDDVAEVVADLVGASDQLTVLATSRAPMAITAESVYPLSPLEIDESGSPATELFRVRAQAVRPSVRLDPVVVAQLCRSLDGLPLAIELAAARARTMSVEDIDSRLADRFELLRSRDRTSPQRHRTLYAVIDWSWNLLEPDQRAALRRLCRFPAGFTLDAAVAVAQWGEVTDAADAVEGLVAQSMLTVVEGRSGLRYLMLETVREFGEEQLAAAGADEQAQVAGRTIAWAEGFCRHMIRRFLDGAQTEVSRAVDSEHDNLLSVLRHALAENRGRTVLTVFPVLGALWTLRGTHSEVTDLAVRILAIDPDDPEARDAPGNGVAVGYMLLTASLAFSGVGRSLALARVRLRRTARREDLDPVVALCAALFVLPVGGRGLARALAAAVRHPDPASRCAALMVRANVRENNGDLYGSAVDGRAALVLARSAGEEWTMSMVDQHLGNIAAQSARYEEAVRHLRAGMEPMRDLFASSETVAMHGAIAAALAGLGRVGDARRELNLAGPLVERLDRTTPEGNRQGAVAIAVSRAEIDLAAGDVDAGLQGYRSALALLRLPDLEKIDNSEPMGLMVMAAAVDAHVLAGRAREADDVIGVLAVRAVARLGPEGRHDLPQTGAVVCAIGAYDIATGSVDGVRLLALSTRVSPRQDFPSMRVATHLARAREVLGDGPVDDALAAVAEIPRRRAQVLIVDELRTRTVTVRRDRDGRDHAFRM